MSTRPTHYHLLGLPRNATAEHIRRAYRAKAKALHPDVNPSKTAAKEFAQLAAAYEVLGSVEKRRAYDRKLAAAEDRSGPVTPGQAHYTWDNVASRHSAPRPDISEIDDLYDTFFARKKPGDSSKSSPASPGPRGSKSKRSP